MPLQNRFKSLYRLELDSIRNMHLISHLHRADKCLTVLNSQDKLDAAKCKRAKRSDRIWKHQVFSIIFEEDAKETRKNNGARPVAAVPA